MTLPVVAPTGTVAVIEVAETTLNVTAVRVLNLTTVAPVKFVPLIVTVVPTGPEAGVNAAMVGAGITVKVVALVAVPPGVLTVILPVAAPTGTIALIQDADSTVNLPAIPPNFTTVAPDRFVPLITIAVPTGPIAGEKEVIVGAGTITAKFSLLTAVPATVVTEIVPLVAPAGTIAVIDDDEVALNVRAVVPLNVTLVVVARFVPLTVTLVPTLPEVGEKDVMVGGGITVKGLTLRAVPPSVVTVIGPVVVPGATVAVIDVLDPAVNEAAATPLNDTAEALLRLVPVIATGVPTGPDAGVKETMVGG